jgi:hypothetical protein
VNGYTLAAISLQSLAVQATAPLTGAPYPGWWPTMKLSAGGTEWLFELWNGTGVELRVMSPTTLQTVVLPSIVGESTHDPALEHADEGLCEPDPDDARSDPDRSDRDSPDADHAAFPGSRVVELIETSRGPGAATRTRTDPNLRCRRLGTPGRPKQAVAASRPHALRSSTYSTSL